MADSREELRRWQDWTDPDFFAEAAKREQRVLTLFLRQLLPARMPRTKLTLTGWVLILVALGIGSAAYNTASNILFLTLSLLLSSLVLSGILSQINFHKLKWSLRVPRHLRAGEAGLAEVELRNGKRWFPAMSLCVRVGDSESESARYLHLRRALATGGSSSLDWTLLPQRRGCLQVELSGVESQFPFGFLMKSLGTDLSEEVLVWPRRVEYSFQPEQLGFRHHAGRSKRRAGGGSDLLNVRPYERGDPPRLVHWKASARVGKLMIRQLAQEGVAGFKLYIDPAAAIWAEADFEQLCGLVATLSESLFHAGRLESVQFAGEAPFIIRDLQALYEVFDTLARLQLVSPTVPAAAEAGPLAPNQVTFRPGAAGGVEIHLADQKAGHAHA